MRKRAPRVVALFDPEASQQQQTDILYRTGCMFNPTQNRLVSKETFELARASPWSTSDDHHKENVVPRYYHTRDNQKCMFYRIPGTHQMGLMWSIPVSSLSEHHHHHRSWLNPETRSFMDLRRYAQPDAPFARGCASESDDLDSDDEKDREAATAAAFSKRRRHHFGRETSSESESDYDPQMCSDLEVDSTQNDKGTCDA
jgi:hypothetical protein